MILMVPCRFFGQKALASGRNVSFTGVGESFVRLVVGIVAKDADADFIGRAFDSQNSGLALGVGADVMSGSGRDGEIPDGIGAGAVCCSGCHDDLVITNLLNLDRTGSKK